MNIRDVPTVVLVASGKGGVGKTTVSSDLAHYLNEQGVEVGVIDADISTPNTPGVLTGGDADFSDQRVSDGENLLPVDAGGVQLFSQGLDLPDDVVLLRDGTFRSELVADHIENVAWDDGTEVVIVDSPPGSGEEVQTVLGAVEPGHALIVTTPHPSSLLDAHRTHLLMEQAEVPAHTVANMTHITGADVLNHVWNDDAAQSVQGVGEAKAEALYEELNAVVEDFGLFNADGDIEEAVGAEVVAEVPYTENGQARRNQYANVADLLLTPQEVEA